ncbi:hypothetical protein B7R22_13855 [Subtercola boreus]|uniref:Uncharacterized protein n=1 Tax=Subtercola boreus TaxID=120213 RepID=A0A3E0VTG5_9MICO|nr:hypothetical protein [Subtercola boreus]RFA13176.1 hypothetical protein B7R22_13855 [Subtercola boreus]
MNDDTEDDLPTRLTRLLRNVDGVHTVYATKSLLPSLVGAVVEAVRNDPVGMHLVTVSGDADELTVVACIGVAADEPATMICRRAHDALRDYFTDQNLTPPTTVRVQVGRVG